MRFLSDEWFAFVVEQAAALPERAGASLVAQHVIAGVPEVKKLTCTTEFRDGRLVQCAPGKRADATCSVQWTHTDALAALRGADLDVAFMRGTLKLDGDYRTFLLDLRPVFASAEGAAFLSAVRDATDD